DLLRIALTVYSIPILFGIVSPRSTGLSGFNVKLFSMDLNFNGVYCLNQIGKMILPTEHANFLTIIPVILNFYSLLKRVNHAIEKLNAPSTPTNQSYHRLSNSSPQKVISILKLPPPAALI
ncbi:1880_t:CDS:2, partial [Entrophospora sp. SA101]